MPSIYFFYLSAHTPLSIFFIFLFLFYDLYNLNLSTFFCITFPPVKPRSLFVFPPSMFWICSAFFLLLQHLSSFMFHAWLGHIKAFVFLGLQGQECWLLLLTKLCQVDKLLYVTSNRKNVRDKEAQIVCNCSMSNPFFLSY